MERINIFGWRLLTVFLLSFAMLMPVTASAQGSGGRKKKGEIQKPLTQRPKPYPVKPPKPKPKPEPPRLPSPPPKPEPEPTPPAPQPAKPTGVYYNTSTDELCYGNHRYKMIWVAGGSFNMGSDDSDAYDDEKPVHRESVSGFYMGRTEVPQWLWVAVMGSNPSKWKDDDLPVEMVSWDDCQDFLRKLNSITGKRFRLPTEPEWEYAARGGNQSRGYKYSGSPNVGSVAWYGDNSGSRTHLVGTKAPNELGLYDMTGNVWEWTSDRYSSDYSLPRNSSHFVGRGGSWGDAAWNCRVSLRRSSVSAGRSSFLGFRLAL